MIYHESFFWSLTNYANYRLTKYLTPDYENADQNTTIGLLSSSGSTMPWRGVAFMNNVIGNTSHL